MEPGRGERLAWWERMILLPLEWRPRRRHEPWTWALDRMLKRTMIHFVPVLFLVAFWFSRLEALANLQGNWMVVLVRLSYPL